MAGIARYRRVCAEKREPVEVVLDGLQIYAPPAHGVAVLTSAAHLTAMDIGVAIGAFVPYIREDFADVALAAGDVGMHRAQRIFGIGVVIEFRLGANRLPTHRGMAALAGDRDGPVRILRLLLRRLGERKHRHCGQNERPPSALKILSRRHHLVREDTLVYHD